MYLIFSIQQYYVALYKKLIDKVHAVFLICKNKLASICFENEPSCRHYNKHSSGVFRGIELSRIMLTEQST